MSYIKKVHCKPRLHVSVNLLFGGWPPYLARLYRRRRRRRRAYAPTSNTAGHDHHEKSTHGFPFLLLYEYGASLGGPSGRQSSAINLLVK